MKYLAWLLLCFSIMSCGPSSSTVQQSHPALCQAHDSLPDAKCTPGAIFLNATSEQICTPGYARSVRDVSQSLKNKAYAEYGIVHHGPGQYEIDHLISLAIGGSNELTNLWPEPAQPTPGFHEKDQVENYLHAEVCSGKMALKDAQTTIATNWKQFLHRKD